MTTFSLTDGEIIGAVLGSLVLLALIVICCSVCLCGGTAGVASQQFYASQPMPIYQTPLYQPQLPPIVIQPPGYIDVELDNRSPPTSHHSDGGETNSDLVAEPIHLAPPIWGGTAILEPEEPWNAAENSTSTQQTAEIQDQSEPKVADSYGGTTIL